MDDSLYTSYEVKENMSYFNSTFFFLFCWRFKTVGLIYHFIQHINADENSPEIRDDG